MWFFRRRRTQESPKEAALARARRAAARVRRDQADMERYRAGKQPNPAGSMTANQRLGSGG